MSNERKTHSMRISKEDLTEMIKFFENHKPEVYNSTTLRALYYRFQWRLGDEIKL